LTLKGRITVALSMLVHVIATSPGQGGATTSISRCRANPRTELSGPVALSDRAVRALAQIKRARSEHLQVHGTEPTNEELVHATGLTRAQIAMTGCDVDLEAARRSAGVNGQVVEEFMSTGAVVAGRRTFEPAAAGAATITTACRSGSLAATSPAST
jgi:hypothetical protein